MAIAYYIPQSHHQYQSNSGNSTTTTSTTTTTSSSESTITIPINQGSANSISCWELLAKVFCFALRFCHQTPSQGVLRITFECQTTSQQSSTSSTTTTTTTGENTTNKFKN